MPNNRQWAILIWLAVAAVALLRQAELRSSLRGLIGTLLGLKLVGLWTAFAVYVGGLVLAGYTLGIWTWDLATDTFVWAVGTALVLLFKVAQHKGEPGFFRRTVLATVHWSVFVEFVVNVRVFSLPVELLLQPILFILLLLPAFAEAKPQYAQVKRLLDIVLSAIGFALLVTVVALVIRDWGQLDPTAQGLSLALPVWLTLGFLPFFAVTAIWFLLDHIYVHLRSDTNTWRDRVRGMTAVLTTLGFNQTELRAFVGYWPRELGKTPNYTQARRVVSDFEAHRVKQAEAEQEEKRLQERYRGTSAVDPDGRRYDRRGFDDAKASLTTLASFQFGHFSRESRYASTVGDLLPASMAHLIKVDSDQISLHTNKGRNEYWMFVRTETGFHFGVAGRDGEHATWLFAGEDPPKGGIDDSDWRHVVRDPAHTEW